MFAVRILSGVVLGRFQPRAPSHLDGGLCCKVAGGFLPALLAVQTLIGVGRPAVLAAIDPFVEGPMSISTRKGLANEGHDALPRNSSMASSGIWAMPSSIT